MKDVFEALAELYVIQTLLVDKDSFVRTEYARLDAELIIVVHLKKLVSTNNVQIHVYQWDNVDHALNVVYLTMVFNAVAQQIS